MRFRPYLLAWTLVLALVAASCGSAGEPAEVNVASDSADNASAPADDTSEPDTPASDDDSDSDDGGSDDDGADGDGDDGDAAPSGVENGETSMAASSPLGSFFADDGGFQSAIEEYRTRVEEEIKKCMAAQGFEFAVTGNGGQSAVQEAQNDLTEREWTLEYGYGISTSFDTIAQQQASDPNAEIIFSLTPGEREIWIETLLGADNDLGDLGDDNIPMEDRGCIGSSIIATGGQDPIEGLEEFGEAYEEGEESIFDTNEMIVAVGDWTRCMSEGGFPNYSELEAPEDSIGERMDAITAPLQAALDELDGDEGRALIEGDQVDIDALPGLDVDALRALQDEEKKTALADLDCYDTHVRATYEPLRDAFEFGLMDTYGSELNAIKNIGS